MDFAVPVYYRVKIKEGEKLKKKKYFDLARELKKLWNVKIMVIPIIVGTYPKIVQEIKRKDRELFGSCQRVEKAVET